MKNKIAVVDYGLGNLRSVSKALEISGGEVLVTSEEDKSKLLTELLFPESGLSGKAWKT